MTQIQDIPLHLSHIFAPRLHRYCAIVGVLNEGDKFRSQLARMQPYRDRLDIVIADGGSTDGATTPDYLQDKATALLVKTGPGFLSTQYRIALHFALTQGYDGMIMVDGHGKDGMTALPKFIEALNAGHDMVQGSRFIRGGQHARTPIDRILAIRLIFNPLMALASGFPYTDATNGFKAVSRAYLLDPRVHPFRPVFKKYNLQYYLNYRAPRLRLKVCEIPVVRLYPKTGKTPTKISGLAGRLDILKELFLTISGAYNPKET